MTQRSAIADTICRTIELGVTITDAALDGEDRTHVFCHVLAPNNTCAGCGQPGRLRDHVDREVADLPIVGHPTRLHIAVPRYVCANPDCATTIFRADIFTMVAPRAQVTRRTTTWILRSMICDKMSVSAAAAAVGLSWNTLLAGRLRGLARESTALRSLALDDASATWAVRIARGEASALGKIQFTSNTRGTSLKLDGVGLAVHEALLPDLVAKYQKVAKSKKEAVRIAVSRAVGWPVTHKVTLPEQATTTEDGGVLTIITPSLVELTISVDENEFLSRLGALTGRGKRIALAAFDLRKK